MLYNERKITVSGNSLDFSLDRLMHDSRIGHVHLLLASSQISSHLSCGPHCRKASQPISQRLQNLPYQASSQYNSNSLITAILSNPIRRRRNSTPLFRPNIIHITVSDSSTNQSQTRQPDYKSTFPSHQEPNILKSFTRRT